MLNVLGTFSIIDDVDKEKSYLLHAHLASLLDGLEAGHIDNEAYRAFLNVLRDKLQTYGLIDADSLPTGVTIRAEPMWSLFVDSIATAAKLSHSCGRPISLADTRKSNGDYCGSELVTFGRLEFQANLAKTGAADLKRKRIKLSGGDIVRKSGNRRATSAIVEYCNHALARGLATSADYFKGSAFGITWIAPVEGVVSQRLSRADAFGLLKKDMTVLRDLLGLWLENGNTKRPLAAFFLDCRERLAAPNVFTAQGYERFRHRPPAALADSPNSGLTYNMGRTAATDLPGASEIVADAIVMPQVKRMVAGGQPASFRFNPISELEAHRVYSEEVHRGLAVNVILDRLEALVRE